jgi:hypothetical protein
MRARRRRVRDPAADAALSQSQEMNQRLEPNDWMLRMLMWLQGLPEGQAPEGFGPKEAAPVIKDFAARWTSALEALHRFDRRRHYQLSSARTRTLQIIARRHFRTDAAACVA